MCLFIDYSNLAGFFSLNLISQEVFMINNPAALLNARTTSSNSHADELSMSKAFYDRVRSNFLRQSASYLSDSLSRTMPVSIAYSNNPGHLKIQQG